MKTYIDTNGLTGVVRISADAGFPRPHVGIIGSVHGDEPCGMHAIEHLQNSLTNGDRSLRRGTVVLVHANPRASELRVRHTPEGADLNRILDFAFVRRLKENAWGYEHHRAQALRPVLTDLDALLDIHSSGFPTPPFVIANGVTQSVDWANQLSVPFIIEAWDTLADQITTGVLERQGKPALGVECGAHDAAKTSQNAKELAEQFLSAIGLLEATPKKICPPPKHVLVRETITKPSERFRFSRPINGFERLAPGTVVGSDGLVEIRTTTDCYAVLPNDTVDVGEDVLYLAVDA